MYKDKKLKKLILLRPNHYGTFQFPLLVTLQTIMNSEAKFAKVGYSSCNKGFIDRFNLQCPHCPFPSTERLEYL